jgi:MtN3 and saliva related transmembrane protein
MKKGWKSKFDELMVVAGIISPLATIPQIIKLYATHTQHASGQSLITWTVYTVISFLWVIYGVMNRQLPILIGNALGTIVYSIVVMGILIHAGFTF